jgi:hypothetical protein
MKPSSHSLFLLSMLPFKRLTIAAHNINAFPRRKRVSASLIALAIALCLCFGQLAAQAQQEREAPLTNASIIKLVRAGFKEKTVITIIRARPTQFDLAPDRLIELKRVGVSERIIIAMLARDDAAFMDGDDWSDDPFFKDSASPSKGANGNGSTDIFGLGGDSRNRTRSRGTRGGNDDNTETQGSATVRILRPPAETGGASASPPKLERTPTLTNESIIELVEAGFSEGTVIRRIEQSPAEFNLTAPKLAELRKRRVSEAIINAMTAAMSDDPASQGKR